MLFFFPMRFLHIISPEIDGDYGRDPKLPRPLTLHNCESYAYPP